MVVQRKIWLAFGVAASLSGCTVGPDYQLPEIAVPAMFGAPARQIVTQDSVPPPEALRWWQTLHDPELNRVVQRAIECNPDLEIALARVQALRTQQIVVLGAALPQADASAGGGQGTGTDLTKGRVTQPIRAGDNSAGLSKITWISGFDAGWEVDVWGKYRRELEAARDDAEAYTEFRNAVLITVVADVVRAYTDLRGLQLRLKIARNAVKAAQKSVDLTQARFNRGLTNELDVTLAKRELASVQARVPQLIAAISHAESLLAILTGTFSGDLLPQLRGSALLPRAPSRLRPGAPADLGLDPRIHLPEADPEPRGWGTGSQQRSAQHRRHDPKPDP